MRRVLGTSLFCCLLVFTLIFLPACQNGEEQEGQLPDWQVGDNWTWSHLMDGTTTILTEEIVDEETVEGRACYVFDMVFDPEMSYTYSDMECTVTDMQYWGDKANALLGVKQEYSVTCNGYVSASIETYSYSPWTSLFPLEIGKEVEMEKTTTRYSAGEQIGDPVVTTESYDVVGKEDITVAAGTFSCWKITIYDSAIGDTRTMWYSDEVKSVVKMTDADGNTLMELQSYSVD